MRMLSRQRFAPSCVHVCTCTLRPYAILMNKFCLKNFALFEQVKYGGVTYT